MPNYTKTTNFTIKDSLLSGDPNKIVRGTEFDIEFNALQTAINELDTEKADLAGSASQAFAINALTVAGGITNTGTGAVATLGAELVTNGVFTGSATGWTLGTHWAYGTDNVILTNSGASGTLSQNISVVSGLDYVVSWTQTNSVDQNCHITPSIGSVNGTKCAQGTSAVLMSQIITPSDTGSLSLAFSVTDITNTGTITVDNVSVKLITAYAAHETIKHNSSDTRPTEIRHTWNGVNYPSLGIGWHAGQNNTTGYNNSFVGATAGQNNTTGYSNNFVGTIAGQANTTGYSNNFVGAGSGQSNTTGYSNNFVGIIAGQANTTGYSNNFIGAYAGQSNTTGYNNTFSGMNAGLSNTTGNYNSFVGASSGLANTTGFNNSFVGISTGYANTTGYLNSFVGASAGQNNTTGYQNSFVGFSSGLANTTGYNNSCFGSNSGNDPVATLTTQNNYIVLGNNSSTNANIKIAWTVTSDSRDKCNFAPVPHGLSFINQLKPTAYFYNKSREDNTPALDSRKRYGFIAQDVLEIEGEDSVIIDDRDTENLKFNEQSLLAVLVKAVQELSNEVAILKQKE